MNLRQQTVKLPHAVKTCAEEEDVDEIFLIAGRSSADSRGGRRVEPGRGAEPWRGPREGIRVLMCEYCTMTSEELETAFASTCVVVPAFNEGRSIASVVQSIEEHMPRATVAVVNDGSRDDTAQRAREAGATVLDLAINLGIGGAVQTGFKFALERGFTYVIQIDGDGQHDPSESRHLIETLVDGGADIAIGSRWLGRGDYVAARNRRYGMKILESIVSWRAESRFTDTTSGFRALNRRAIALFAEHYPRDYPEVESIVVAHHYGLTVVEVPVAMKQREHGESSIRGLKSLYFMVRVTMGLMLGVVGGDTQ